jgi:hypothetical protein
VIHERFNKRRPRRPAQRDTPKVNGRGEHEGRGKVDAIVFYQSLCNRVFSINADAALPFAYTPFNLIRGAPEDSGAGRGG